MRRLWFLVPALGLLLACSVSSVSADELSASEKLVRRGVELRARGKDKRALVLFKRAYDMDQSAAALAYIGETEYSLGMYTEAQAHLNEALALEDPWIHRHRAAIERTLERASKKAPAAPDDESMTVVIKSGERSPPSPEQRARLLRAERALRAVENSLQSVHVDLDKLEGEFQAVNRRFTEPRAKAAKQTIETLQMRVEQCSSSLNALEKDIGEELAQSSPMAKSAPR